MGGILAGVTQQADPSAATGPLAGIRVLSIAVNLPGPVAVSRLVELGASATTVLPPTGDPLQLVAPDWYTELHEGQDLITLDLKDATDRAQLDELLAATDLFVTSSRPSALARLGLDFVSVSGRHTQVCQVDIVGHPADEADLPGHDLTYQAVAGLVDGDRMPRTLLADLAGAERAAGEAAAALVARTTTGRGVRREVALSSLAFAFAAPVRHGLTAPTTGVLGGALPTYRVYPAKDGYVALAALEQRFVTNLLGALELTNDDLSTHRLEQIFAGRTTAEWDAFGRANDIPLAPVSPPTGAR